MYILVNLGRIWNTQKNPEDKPLLRQHHVICSIQKSIHFTMYQERLYTFTTRSHGWPLRRLHNCHRKKSERNWVCSAQRRWRGRKGTQLLFQYLQSSHREDGNTFSRVVSTGQEVTGGGGINLHIANFFSENTLKYWNRFPRGREQFPFLEIWLDWIT